MRQRLVPLLVLLSALAVGACTLDRSGPFFTGSAGVTTGPVDAAAAAREISRYRAARGLPPVTVDSRLMNIARDHARRMATDGRMAHVLPGEGSFQERLAAGGFKASLAAENIAAGQQSLAEVLETWRTSRNHNSNLLKPGVSLMGIANAYAPNGRYKVYWALVLAEPYVPPPDGGGPTAGLIVGPAALFGSVFGR